MKLSLSKGKYQWQYVIVAVMLSFVICGSFIWWKFGNSGVKTANKSFSITSTTAPISGKPDVIGKEPRRTTTTNESTLIITTSRKAPTTAKQTSTSGNDTNTNDTNMGDNGNNNNNGNNESDINQGDNTVTGDQPSTDEDQKGTEIDVILTP